MTTFREIREDFLSNTSNSIRTVLRGPVIQPHFFRKVTSPFSSFENAMPEELEQICDGEMRLLLSGFQTDNIRIEFDTNENFVGLSSNPSFDPFMRSAIDRFTDVVRDLYTIRVRGYLIHRNLLKSRIARLVVGNLSKKVDVLLAPIMAEGWIQGDEGFHDSDFGLNGLTRSIAVVRPSIRCFADIIDTIYEKNLCGGEVIDLLEEKLERVVSDQAELKVVLRIAWKAFFEMAGSWISRGVLEDPCYEFFIWPRDKIKAVNQSLLDNALQEGHPQCEEAIKNDPFLLVPGLCPIRVQHIMADIYRCGRSVQQSKQVDSFEWDKLDSAARFMQKVLSLSAETSQSALNKLKTDGHLSDFISCFHMTLLNSPWLGEVTAALLARGLVNRKYNEVADGALQALTHLTLMRHVGQLPFMKNFKFVRGTKDLFEALQDCSLVVGSADSSVYRKSNVEIAMLPERLSLAVDVPQQMAGLFSHDTVNKYCLIFRLQLRVHLAGIVLEECRWNLPRGGIQDKTARLAFQLLGSLSSYLLRFRMVLCSAVQEALRTFNDGFDKATQVESVSRLQRDCINQIFKEASLSAKHVMNIEDLLLLIDAFATNKDLGSVMEHYNVWLEQMESSRFLGSQDMAFHL